MDAVELLYQIPPRSYCPDARPQYVRYTELYLSVPALKQKLLADLHQAQSMDDAYPILPLSDDGIWLGQWDVSFKDLLPQMISSGIRTANNGQRYRTVISSAYIEKIFPALSELYRDVVRAHASSPSDETPQSIAILAQWAQFPSDRLLAVLKELLDLSSRLGGIAN